MEIKDREKLAKEIAKTSKLIRKKYRALKTNRMKKNVALERHFKPIIEPLKQIAAKSANVESNVDVKTETPSTNTSIETECNIKTRRKDKA
ncbi:hypothetical protein EAI_09462 [Harpegnathos saltator]|uniref:Uncharacterized protein n=1 Tax=Harpegnathos saltator TaxID=610380 RepID=E2B2G8_HARSA|nr:hypothetical protein EAI_09462 [Harpegnathos saltator]